MNPQDLQQIEQYLRAAGLKADELRNRMDAIRNSTAEFNRELGNAQRHFADISGEFNDLSKQFKNVLDDLRGWDSTSGRINRSFKTLGGLADKLKYDALDISNLNKKDLESLQKKAKIEEENLRAQKVELDSKYQGQNLNRLERIAQERGLTNTLKEIAQYRELNGIFGDGNKLKEEENNYVYKLLKLTEERLKKEKQIESSIGLTGNALKALSKIPGIGGALKTEEAIEAMKKEAKALQDQGKNINNIGNRLKIAGKGISTAFSGLKESLTDPVSIIVFFASKINEANKQVVELGKSFGVSYEVANQLREESVAYARSANDTFVNTNRLLKAQTELSQQLGIAVKFSGEEAETFSRLTELVGLSADEAGNLAKFSAAAGVETKDYEGSLLKGAFAAQQTTKSHFSAKQILQDVSKLSAGILVKFQGNPEALGKAVAQARALGLTLEQVDKVSESILNFESSIENELKAELITGKQLNLEKARYVALTGDQAELSKEIAEQAGSLEDFQNMNVIAQKSLAEAFGMSRDELADMLMKQEMINKFGDEAAQLNKEQLADFQKQNKERGIGLAEYLQKQSEQLAAQDRFNNAITKLQDIIGNLVAGPFGQMLNIISSILEQTTALAAIMGGAMVLNFMKVLSVMKQAKKISYGAAIVEIIKSAYQSIGGLPGVGMILAGAAAAAGISYLASQSAQSVEDGIAPADKGPFTITDKFGATAITATGDGVAVGPNINASPSISSPSLDLSPITNAITVLSSRMETLMNKQQTIPQFSLQVDGKAIGTAVGKQIETGTAQSQYTSYKVA
jgi:hypothetical protein